MGRRRAASLTLGTRSAPRGRPRCLAESGTVGRGTSRGQRCGGASPAGGSRSRHLRSFPEAPALRSPVRSQRSDQLRRRVAREPDGARPLASANTERNGECARAEGTPSGSSSRGRVPSPTPQNLPRRLRKTWGRPLSSCLRVPLCAVVWMGLCELFFPPGFSLEQVPPQLPGFCRFPSRDPLSKAVHPSTLGCSF